MSAGNGCEECWQTRQRTNRKLFSVPFLPHTFLDTEKPLSRTQTSVFMFVDDKVDKFAPVAAPEVDVEDFEYLPKQTEKFFTEGGMELKHARMQVRFSLLNATSPILPFQSRDRASRHILAKSMWRHAKEKHI